MTMIFSILLIVTNLLVLPVLVSQALEGVGLAQYLLGLIASITVYLLFAVIRTLPKTTERVRYSDLLWAVFAAALPTLVFLDNMHSYSLWLDEYVNAKAMGQAFDMIHNVARTQQPPLAYYWGWLTIKIFGYTENGARMYTVAAGFLFLFTMFFNLKKLTSNRFYSFLGTLILGFNPFIILYAVEARPYMVSLFYFSVVLHFLLELVFSAQKRAPFGFLIAGLTASALLWLLSISMQPLFFIFIFMIYFLLISALRKSKLYLFIAISLACSLLLNLPILLYVVSLSQAYMKTTGFTLPVYLHSLWSNLLTLAWDLSYNQRNRYLYFAMLVVIGISMVTAKKHRLFLWNAFLMSLGFALILTIAFTLKIEWMLQARYLITGVPLFYMTFLFSLHLLTENWPPWIKNSSLACLVVITFAMCTLEKPLKQICTDWRGLYEKIDERTAVSAKAYFFSFTTPEQFSDAFFIASEFYPSTKVAYPAMSDYSYPDKLTNDFLFSDLQKDEKMSEFYFAIFSYTLEPDLFAKFNIANSEKYSLTSFYLIKINEPNGLLPAAKAFFNEAELVMKDVPKKIFIYDGLFLIAAHERDCTGMRKYFAKVTELAPRYNDSAKRVNLFAEKMKDICR